MKLLPIAAAAAVATALAAAYWHLSPHLALSNARAAAATGDADKLAAYVDVERVRANLKARLRGYGALDGMAATVALHELASPQALAGMVAAGQPVATVSTAGPAVWRFDRPTLDMVIASPTFQEDLPPQSRVRFVWERSGFATWRLTEIRMPGMV